MELLLTGNLLSADQALRIGLVNRVVSADEVCRQRWPLQGVSLEMAPWRLGRSNRHSPSASGAPWRKHFSLKTLRAVSSWRAAMHEKAQQRSWREGLPCTQVFEYQADEVQRRVRKRASQSSQPSHRRCRPQAELDRNRSG